jgi:hypothetical protein
MAAREDAVTEGSIEAGFKERVSGPRVSTFARRLKTVGTRE